MSLFGKLTGKKSGILEEAKKSIQSHVVKPLKQAKKEVEQEFGVEEGAVGRIKELFVSSAEKLGKDPRVGKSFAELAKAALGAVKVINSSPEKQDAAVEKLDKACATFIKAVKAFFKNQSKSHGHESEPPKKKEPAKNAAPKERVPGPREAALLRQREGTKSVGKGGRHH